jgi:molybdopterin-containing oxidoreductase family membrane subunit
MFIIMSFAWGLAVFLITQAVMFRWNGKTLDPAILKRMKNLFGTFIAAVLYFLIVYHLTNLYFAKQVAFEKFILIDSGFAAIFWIGQVLIGALLPMAILYHPRLGQRMCAVTAAAVLVIVGAFCELYVFIIGGEAFPLDIFPGAEITSSFFDGQVATYSPSLPEFLLGLGGLGVAFMITLIGVRLISKFLPEDDAVQPDAATD